MMIKHSISFSEKPTEAGRSSCGRRPFKADNLSHIARGTLPIITDSPSDESGIGDLVLFGLIVFDKSRGLGPVMPPPTATESERPALSRWHPPVSARFFQTAF